VILIRSDAALADVDEIWLFIARDSEREADRLLGRIDGAYRRLLDFPRMGVERTDLSAGIRAVRLENYVIYYRLEPDAVSIERVLHSRRDATQVPF
jgi:toxin ParE1/3/4